MPNLSTKKLISLIEKKGYYCSKFFCYNKMCVYVEIIERASAECYMLYIPSKYDIQYDSTKYPCYEVKYLDLHESSSIVDKYSGIDDIDKNHYNSIELSTKYHQAYNMEDKLTMNYENNIILNNFESGEHFDLRCIVRQLDRLKHCVSKIDYKLAIFYKKYLCVIKRDNSIECFYIKKLQANYRNILISFDLEMLYTNVPVDLNNDLSHIKTSLYKIFDSNSETHLKYICTIFDKKNDITTIYRNLLNKKNRYSTQINSYQNLYDTLNKKEKAFSAHVKEEMRGKNKYSNNGTFILKMDKIKRDARNILDLQNKIISNISLSTQKYNDVLLTVDKILFDNIVMLDKIMKNFNMIHVMLRE